MNSMYNMYILENMNFGAKIYDILIPLDLV